MTVIKAKKASKRARKVNVAPVESSAVAPALQITFHASIPEIQETGLTVVESLDYDSQDSDNVDVLAQYQIAIAQCFVERIKYEVRKDALHCSDKIKSHAKKVVQNQHVLNVFFDSLVVPDFINRSERANYCFNEKTCERMIDASELIALKFLPSATSATSKLHYVASVFRSIARFEKAGVAFTTEHAFAACSNERVFSNEINELMSYNWKSYGSTTQQAQHSMTLNALVELHAINERFVNGKARYTVNPESFAGQRLSAILEC